MRQKPKYSGPTTTTTTTTAASRPRHNVQHDDDDDDDVDDDTVDNQQSSNTRDDDIPAVRAKVVERPRTPKKKLQIQNHHHNNTKTSDNTIEGYTPITGASTIAAAAASSNTVRHRHRGAAGPKVQWASTTSATAALDRATKDDHDDDEPLVFNSLADMMQVAGTLPPNDQSDGPPHMVEAELNFSCMDPDEFERQQQQGQRPDEADDDDSEEERLASHVSNDDDDDHVYDDDDDDEENIIPPINGSEQQQQDTDDLWDLLGGNDDDDNEETVPPPPPRAFGQLWTALSQWVTPQAVTFIHNLHTTTTTNNNNTVVVPPQPAVVFADDVCAARCAGLWSQLPWERAVRALQQNSPTNHPTSSPPTVLIDWRIAEQRLAHLLRCFNYHRPVKLASVELYRALACVLLDMVMGVDAHSIDYDDDDNPHARTTITTVPAPCRVVGLTADEYRYLTRVALTNLGDASTAAVYNNNNRNETNIHNNHEQ